MERKESIEAIKNAYENEKLGFQNGMSSCKYYDAKTDSYCAVGVLIGYDDSLINDLGNIEKPFKNADYCEIKLSMENAGLTKLYGLTIDELDRLQILHDHIINSVRYRSKKENDFKDYLYSLN
jgi:hypothetical protein